MLEKRRLYNESIYRITAQLLAFDMDVHSRTLDNKIIRIQKRPLRKVYSDYKSSFIELLDKKLLDKALRSSRLDVFCKKGVLRKIPKLTGKHLCQSLFLIKLQAESCNFTKKETLAQALSCEFCEISENTFSHRTPPVAASGSFTIDRNLSKF